MRIPFARLIWERFIALCGRLGEGGAGGAARWVVFVALIAHLGWYPGAGSSALNADPINYDDPQVLDAAERSSVKDILTGPTYYAYKPIYFLSLKLDRLFGDPVHVGHTMNWLLHALCAVLLTVLLAHVFRNAWLAGIAGALFAVHPAHAESVAWLAERKDVLSLAFVLWAHISFRLRREDRERGDRPFRPGDAFVPALWLLLGGLTKGTVWSYAGIIAIDEILHQARKDESARAGVVARLAPLCVVAVGGVVLDAWMGAAYGPGAVKHGVGNGELVAAMGGVHLQYLLNVLVPVNLALDYAIDPAGSFGLGAWLGILLAVLAVVGLFVSLRRRSLLGAFACSFWIFGLAPVNNIWPRTSILMADRYLYIPAIGAYLLIAYAINRSSTFRKPIAVAVVVLLGTLCIERTRDFADSETVWADTIEKVPHSALAYIQLGQEHARMGQGRKVYYERALEDVDHVFRIEPRPRLEFLLRARLVKCAALAGLGRINDLAWEADAAMELANQLERSPLLGGDVNGLKSEIEIFRGQALEAKGLTRPAIEAYDRAVKADPDNGVARYNFATALAGLGGEELLEEAEFNLRCARELLRGGDIHTLATIQLATVLGTRATGARTDSERDGLVSEALRLLRNHMKRVGRTPELLYASAMIHLNVRRDLPRVKELLYELSQEHPDHEKGTRLQAQIYFNEGQRELRKGRNKEDRAALREAVQRFKFALEADPSFWEAHVAAGDAWSEQGLFNRARDRYKKAAQIERGAPWIKGLVARTHVLECYIREQEAEDEAALRSAAQVMAGGMRLDVDRIDLGFIPLEDELPLVREVAALLEANEEPAATHAAKALRAVARLCAGDQDGALGLANEVMAALGSASPSPLRDTCLLIRAVVYTRRTDFDEAYDAYRRLEKSRPKDVLPKLSILQLDQRIAHARLNIALGGGNQARKDEANARVAAVADRIRAFADAHPASVTAGLLATESDMQQARWVQALARLNEMAERFPKHPSIYRGRSYVHMAQRTSTQDEMLGPHLIKLAGRELQYARALDPRDVRTHLDAAKLNLMAQNIRGAVQHAERARELESYDGGPASRLLATLYVRLARQAIEGRQVKEAQRFIARARKLDPQSPATYVLEGELLLNSTERDRLARALELGNTAKSLAPLDLEAHRFLAKCHRQKGIQAMLAIMRIPMPKNPVNQPGFEALSPDERSKLQTKWAIETDKARKAKARFREAALGSFDLALTLDPDAEDAPDIRTRMEELRKSDPSYRRRQLMEAQELIPKARDLRVAGKDRDALRLYEEIVALDPANQFAHQHILALTWKLLPGWRKDIPEERKQEQWLVNRAFTSLHMLDKLDKSGVIFERHLFRGLLNAHLYKQEKSEELRVVAKRELQRYLELTKDRPDSPNVARARSWLERVKSKKGG